MALLAVGAAMLLVFRLWQVDPTPSSSDAPGPIPPPGRNSFIEGPPSLRWVLRGTQLLVNGRWVLNPADGGFTELPYATARALQGGGVEPLGLSLSARGESVVLWDAQAFRFGPVRDSLEGPFPIPVLPSALADVAATEARAQVLFWASERQLVLYQFERVADAEPLCGLFDTGSRRWSLLSHCPWGDFLEITRIDPGAGGWISVYSSAEGASALLLARYEPEQGQYDTRAPRFLFSQGRIQAQVSLDGTRIDFATSCVLSEERADCEQQEEGDRWRLYSWRSVDEKLALAHEGLPPGFVPAPGGGQVAWLTPDQVCVGEAAAIERSRCFCLPTRECSAGPARQ